VWFTKFRTPVSIDRRPVVADVPPLAAVTRSSLIVTPVVIPLAAIQSAIESAVPPTMSGKPDIPAPPGVTDAEIGWSLTREPFAITGGPQGLSLASSLSGSLRATGQFGPPGMGGPPGMAPPPGMGPPGMNGRPGNRGAPQGGFTGPPGFPPLPPGFPRPPGGFGPPGFGSPGAPPQGRQQAQTPQPPASQAPGQSGGPAEHRADFRGRLTLTARPNLLPQWRLEPNLSAQVVIDAASAQIMGMTLNLSNEMKPMIERLLNEQISRLQAQVASSDAIEQAVRAEWAKLCRSGPLGDGASGGPKLWLELRPTQALASQPRIDQSSLTFTLGVRAETRIVPSETKPDCAFPSQLEIVPQMDEGRINIDVPVDIPFTEISRLIEEQVKGKAFPVDESGAVKATIQSAKLGASGDRLLITLGIKIDESKSWFGLGAEATIYVWGRPRLDRDRRRLVFDDTALDIESEAAFGLLGLVARAATPSLQKTLAENAMIDLAPLVANARQNMEAAIAELRKNAEGMALDAKVVDVRLAGIQFDANTLRVIVEVDGTIRVEVTKLGPPVNGGR
jgi:hypothetical protein